MIPMMVRVALQAEDVRQFHVLCCPAMGLGWSNSLSFANIRSGAISRCDPFITMGKAAEFRDFHNRAMFHDLPLNRALLFQRQMRTIYYCLSSEKLLPSCQAEGSDDLSNLEPEDFYDRLIDCGWGRNW
jgi:hypothetical protein